MDNDGNMITNITNVKDVEMIHIKGQKVWFDTLEEHSAVTIALYQRDAKGNNKKVKYENVSKDNEWKYDFGYLPKTDEAGQPFTYQVVEENVPEGYVSITSGYDVHNLKMELYNMGTVSISKNVVNTPDKDTSFGFNLYVKALGKLDGVNGVLDEAQQQAKTLLATALGNAKDALEKAELALNGENGTGGKRSLFEDSIFLTNTSASAYRFFMTDDSNNAHKAVTTGSALYVEQVDIALEEADSSLWDGFTEAVTNIVRTVEVMAEEFLGTEDTNRPSTSVMLTRIANEVEVATSSAIAFNENKLDDMFDSMVAHKEALIELDDAAGCLGYVC